jgi:crossover junction endonuclease MUS81
VLPPTLLHRPLTATDSVGSRVETMSSAVIRLDPDEFVNLRKVEFRAEQRSHAFAKQLKLVDNIASVRDSSGKATLFGFILEEGAPPTCSKFDDAVEDEVRDRALAPRTAGSPMQNGIGSKQRLHEPMILDDDGDGDGNADSMPTVMTNQHHSPLKSLFKSDLVSPAASPLARTTSAPFPSIRTDDTGEMRSLEAQAAARRSGLTSAGPSRAQSASADLALPSKPSRPAPRLSSHIPAPTPLMDPSDQPVEPANLPDFDPSDAIIFPRGSYEIVLVVDTREVESKSNRDKIAEALEAKGVKVETRALRLGDMCWIARRLDGLGGEEDECVLDYVAERKRLDDLCISIKDGRYTEQCVSLVHIGRKHLQLGLRS